MYRALAWLLLSLSALAFAQSPEERLFEAIAQGKPLVAEGLVANGRVNLEARNAEDETPLHRAVEKGLRDLAGLFLKSGARVSARSNSGETALHLAALHADPWFAGLLLAAKADPRARNDEGAALPTLRPSATTPRSPSCSRFRWWCRRAIRDCGRATSTIRNTRAFSATEPPKPRRAARRTLRARHNRR